MVELVDEPEPDFGLALDFALDAAGLAGEADVVAVDDDRAVVDAERAEDDRVDEVCDPETWATSFFAPSRTFSPTSPARLIAKSLTVWTPSWTFGWFQTS